MKLIALDFLYASSTLFASKILQIFTHKSSAKSRNRDIHKAAKRLTSVEQLQLGTVVWLQDYACSLVMGERQS